MIWLAKSRFLHIGLCTIIFAPYHNLLTVTSWTNQTTENAIGIPWLPWLCVSDLNFLLEERAPVLRHIDSWSRNESLRCPCMPPLSFDVDNPSLKTLFHQLVTADLRRILSLFQTSINTQSIVGFKASSKLRPCRLCGTSKWRWTW